MEPEQRYRDAVADALAGFQLIEQALKDYLGLFHKAVRKFLPTELTYRATHEDMKDAALGRLLTSFSRYTANDTLVSELRSMIRIRDELAHRALVELYGNGAGELDFEARTTELREVAKRVASLLREVNQESMHVLAVGRGGRAANK